VIKTDLTETKTINIIIMIKMIDLCHHLLVKEIIMIGNNKSNRTLIRQVVISMIIGLLRIIIVAMEV